ncbi:phosphatidylinositol mannoside acyltransferase [Nocardioides mesophilus]|uniref:Phosphatidylinositol mannoside acyltransferase n=1 Tax=Nocardioides mesophilus TaxID=433659 RepID=A0A7G9RA83_9ACTN|nr:phosphatidylinositol mannoside acyltransferase [Nocardioides mesophilus]QNN52508.1 phosphatidylinositol mannoside acyltransferase [Nocardioides mesophilus]
MTGRQGGLARARAAVVDQGAATGYVAGWRLVRRLPEPVARKVFARIGEQIHRRDGSGVRRLRENLRLVCPELDPEALEALTREGVGSYLRYWCEAFRLPTWTPQELVRRTVVVDEHHLRAPQQAGQGVVVALPHMANWDWAGAWACGTGMPLTTVAERLKPERLYDEFVAYRASLGMEILSLTGEQPVFGPLVSRLRAGRLVCLLSDRDLSRTGVEVDLCGAPARMPRGPAMLARATGAPLVPATLAYRGECLQITFHEPVPHRSGPDGVAHMMQGVADAFSAGIHADPQDWHMMQRVFVEHLSPQERR